MKKVVLFLAAIMVVALVGCASAQKATYQKIAPTDTTKIVAAAPAAEETKAKIVAAAPAEGIIPIQDGVEIRPMRSITSWPRNTVCWQAVYDPGRKILRQQIFPINGADENAITQEMKNAAAAIQPQITTASEWQSFGFTCKPGGWTGAGTAAAPAQDVGEKKAKAASENKAVEPNLKAELDALKAKLAAAEEAEAARKAKAPKVSPPADNTKAELDALKAKLAAEKARKAKAAAAKALEDQYRKKLAKLGYEGEKAVPEFQAAAKITADGKLGPQTRRLIDKALAAMEDCNAKKIGGKACGEEKTKVATAPPAEAKKNEAKK